MDRKPEAHLEFRPLRFGGREAERRAGGGAGTCTPRACCTAFGVGRGTAVFQSPGLLGTPRATVRTRSMQGRHVQTGLQEGCPQRGRGEARPQFCTPWQGRSFSALRSDARSSYFL